MLSSLPVLDNPNESRGSWALSYFRDDADVDHCPIDPTPTDADENRCEHASAPKADVVMQRKISCLCGMTRIEDVDGVWLCYVVSPRTGRKMLLSRHSLKAIDRRLYAQIIGGDSGNGHKIEFTTDELKAFAKMGIPEKPAPVLHDCSFEFRSSMTYFIHPLHSTLPAIRLHQGQWEMYFGAAMADKIQEAANTTKTLQLTDAELATVQTGAYLAYQAMPAWMRRTPRRDTF